MIKNYEEMKIESLHDALTVLNILERDEEIKETRDKARSIGSPQKFPFGVWFRGQSHTGWSLEPKVFRFTKNHKFYSETNLYHHSKLRLANLFYKYGTIFDWLCIMQHYDIPTRLLDWTESLLVALYFAVRDSNKNDNSDAEIIVLNARKLNEIIQKECTIYSPENLSVIVLSKIATTRKLKN